MPGANRVHVCLVSLLCTSATFPASALVINSNFIAPGQLFPGSATVATNTPAAAVGGGNIVDVFNAAAAIWASSFDDPYTVTVNFGWNNFTFADGVTNFVSFDAATGRVSEANIRFNDSLDWYLDPTPRSSEEYSAKTPIVSDLGGGPINTNLGFRAVDAPPAIPAIPGGAHRDLLTNALHELSHALNIRSGTLSALDVADGSNDGIVTLQQGPFAGTEIPWFTRGGGHPDIPFPDGDLLTDGLFDNPPGDHRQMPSDADIAIVGAVSDFKRGNVRLLSVAGGAAGPATYVTLPDFSDPSVLTLNGSAQIAGSELRLTPNQTSQAGSVFLTDPFQIGPQTRFETSFAFRLDGGSDGADGLAFVIQGDPAGATALGRDGQGLGYGGIGNSLAVEFDTHFNADFPDHGGSFDPFDHVALTIRGDETVQLIDASLEQAFDLQSGAPFFGWIDYDGTMLSVFLADNAIKPLKPLWSFPIALETITGRGPAFFGFTAATGDGSNAHSLLAWDLNVSRAVSEPAALSLLLAGLLGLSLAVWRRRIGDAQNRTIDSFRAYSR